MKRSSDGLIDRVQQRVLKGMGLLVLHSGHHSKLFRRLMGTNANLSWRETPEGDLERVWVVNPSHPIAEGLPPYFEVNASEMYGEPFDIPQPGRTGVHLVVLGWRSVPQRLHLPARSRPHLLLQPGPRDLSDLSRQDHSQGHLQRYPLGQAGAHDGRILENWQRAQPLHCRPTKS
jgi:hypothetical protein